MCVEASIYLLYEEKNGPIRHEHNFPSLLSYTKFGDDI